MADAYKKISDFSVASSFNDTDLLLVSQSGVTRVIEGSNLKSFAKSAGIDAAKINNAVVNTSGYLVLTTTDGTNIVAGKVIGADGVSVTNASIDAQYHLILTFSDGSQKDAGYCRGASGAGTGDMQEVEYDPGGEVKAAGGITAYVAANTTQGEFIPTSQKGVASGVATLGTDGKVPSSQLNMSSSVSSSSTTTVANSAAVKTVNDKIPTISSSVFSTSTVTAASSYAVKRAYDTALEAKPEFLTPEITCSDSDFSCSACIGLKIGRLIMIYATVSLASNGSFALKIDPGTTISINEGLPEDNGVMFITPKYLVTTIPSALTELVDNYIEATIAVVKGEYNLLFFYVSGS